MNEEDKINQELLDTFQAADLIIKLDYLPDDHPSAIFWKEKYLNLLDDYTDLLKSQAKR
jgi:hypothetical protein